MNTFAILAWSGAGLLAVPNLAFALEVFAGLKGTATGARPSTDLPDTAVLVPAHDEAAGISEMLQSLFTRIGGATRVMVVADNCTDDTANLARAAGADVVERCDPSRRGKGYALAFGRDALAEQPPQIVVVLDADSLPDEGSVALIARHAHEHQRPVQSGYSFAPDSGSDPVVAFSSFAFAVKNLVRTRGASRLGAPVILTGSGMAFPWPVFAQAPLATAAIAEDVALAVQMTILGTPPMYLDSARTLSSCSSRMGTETQRRRWESGFFAIARSAIIPLGRAAWTQRSVAPAALALHLIIPPLVLLLALDCAALLCLWTSTAFTLPSGPAQLLTAAACLALMAVSAAWLKHGRVYLPVRMLGSLPAFMVWKLALSIGVLRSRESRWIRTERP